VRKSLVFWGGGSAAEARRLQEAGAVLLHWTGAEGGLEDVPHRTLGDYLDQAARDAVDEAAAAWTKAWGRKTLRAGMSFREIATWKGVSLWWFAELYLHHSTGSPRRVRIIETLRHVLRAERPDEVEARGLHGEDLVLLERTCTAEKVLFLGARSRPRPDRGLWRVSWRSRWNTLKTAAAALKAAVAGRPAGPPADGRRTVLLLSHAAFWRERADPQTGARQAYEHYFDRLIPELAADAELRPLVVAVGPRAAFRRRDARARLADWLRLPDADGRFVPISRYTSFAVLGEVRRSTREIRRLWGTLRASPAMAEAFSHAGVAFRDLAGRDLAGTLLLQLPWAVRCYEEMAAVLRATRPAAACLYAESSGWGRAALAACRAQQVPTVALQHGILYPGYYSYRHEDDETECPRPDRTAVFGEAARRLLSRMGHYPPEALVVTGSPKFDELLGAARGRDRAALRARLGLADGEALLVVASRHRGIRETHQSIGSAFPALLRAVEALPGVRCLVKPHPAEPAAAYDADLRAAGAGRTRILPPGADLVELLHAADALVTVESLSAVEALVLGRPVVVLNMPTNLRELVSAGAALGVAAGEDPRPALQAVLFDEAARARLDEARARYLSEVAHGVDGQATARILELLRDTARGPRVVALAE
jgi:UDP-N-acetylglucosamine 2-epimerase